MVVTGRVQCQQSVVHTQATRFPLSLPTRGQIEGQTEECSAGLSNGEMSAGQEHRAHKKALLLSDTLKSHQHPLRGTFLKSSVNSLVKIGQEVDSERVLLVKLIAISIFHSVHSVGRRCIFQKDIP